MAIDTLAPRTRRALLGAALGAAGATVATAIGRPIPVRAAGDDGTTIEIGGNYQDVQSQTTLINKHTDDYILYCKSEDSAGFGSGVAIYGYGEHVQGVVGQSYDGQGVYGLSTKGHGVEAGCVEGFGVYSESAQSVGVVGKTSSSTGVFGFCGSNLPTAPAKVGVLGYAAQDAGSRGVAGQSTSGRGVHGFASSGTGVHAESANPMSGTALRATGRVKFDHCVGVATVGAGTKSVVVTPGIDLQATSATVATLQGSAGATTTVHRCSIRTTDNTVTIYLTANSTADVKVAWHVFG
jgi:hypothetical protein